MKYLATTMCWLVLLISSCQSKPSQPNSPGREGNSYRLFLKGSEICLETPEENQCFSLRENLIALRYEGERLSLHAFPREFSQSLSFQDATLAYDGQLAETNLQLEGTELGISGEGEGAIELTSKPDTYFCLEEERLKVFHICLEGKNLLPLIPNTGGTMTLTGETVVLGTEKKIKRTAIVPNESGGLTIVVLENIHPTDDLFPSPVMPEFPQILPLRPIERIPGIIPEEIMFSLEEWEASGNPMPVADLTGICPAEGDELYCKVQGKNRSLRIVQCGPILRIMEGSKCLCAINLNNTCQICLSRTALSESESEISVYTSTQCLNTIKAACPE